MAESPRVLTGSNLDRVRDCPAAGVLPQYPDEPGDAAKAGTEIHTQLEHRSQELDDALGEVGSSINELWPEGGVHEAVVWYDPLRRRGGWKKKAPGSHRDYSEFPPTHLVGTIDYLNPTLGVVSDLKTGWPPPPTSLQLGLATVAMGDQDGLASTKQNMVQFRPGRRPSVAEHHAEVAMVKRDLDGLVGSHLLNRARVEAGAEPEYNPGRRCRYCRAAPGCPFKKE